MFDTCVCYRIVVSQITNVPCAEVKRGSILFGIIQKREMENLFKQKLKMRKRKREIQMPAVKKTEIRNGKNKAGKIKREK